MLSHLKQSVLSLFIFIISAASLPPHPQTNGASHSAFSPYTVNTVQVSNQEKYLIVSTAPIRQTLNLDL